MKVARTMAVAMALSVVAAACGDDEGSTATGDSSASGGGGSSDEFVVGILAPLTGELGTYGEDHVTVYEMAAKDINDAGLLPGGAKLRLVVEDEGGSAEVAVRAARKLVEVDGADVIIGPTSFAMVALAPIAEANKIPVISTSAGTVRLDEIGGEWLFRTYPSDSAEGSAMARFFLDEGIERISVLFQNQESAQGIVKVLTSSFEDGDGEVVQEVEFDGGQPSYQAQVNSALAGDFDLLYLAAGEESAQTIIREIRQAGYEGRLGLNGDLSSPEFLAKVGPDMVQGACAGQAGVQDGSPELDAFVDAYQAVASEESYVTLPNSYDAVVIAALAAVAADEISGTAIQKYLREVAGPGGTAVSSYAEGAAALKDGEDIDYTGPSGIVDFDESGTSPSPFSAFCVDGEAWVLRATYEPGDLDG